MKRNKYSCPIVTCLILAIVSAAAVGNAPAYLHYSDSPEKADFIVVFPGSEDHARREEANQLIKSGFANHFFIPSSWKYMKEDKVTASPSVAPPLYPRFYEHTHIEVLEAKREMDRSDFKKAIFVSSPSHMRRIRIITEHVFGKPDHPGNPYRITFVPARTEEAPSFSWLLDIHRLQQMAIEYTKIAWFCIYKNT